MQLKKQRMKCKLKLLQLQKIYMYKKNVTKKDLCTILFAAFEVYIKETNHKKAELDQMLEEHMEKNSNTAVKNLIVETNDNATTSNKSGNVLSSNNQTANV